MMILVPIAEPPALTIARESFCLRRF
jgi:hypothetical protein